MVNFIRDGEQGFRAVIDSTGAPDGGPLVISSHPVPRNLPQDEAAKEGRANLKRIKNKTVEMGNSGIITMFNKRNRGELMKRHDRMSGNAYRAKLDLAGNMDEIFRTARDIEIWENRKPNTKPNVDGYIYGKAYGKDSVGDTYEMIVKSEVKKDESVNPYSITNIEEVPGRDCLKSGDQLRNAPASRSGFIIS